MTKLGNYIHKIWQMVEWQFKPMVLGPHRSSGAKKATTASYRCSSHRRRHLGRREHLSPSPGKSVGLPLDLLKFTQLFCLSRLEGFHVGSHGPTWKIRSSGWGHHWSHPTLPLPMPSPLLREISPLAVVKLTARWLNIRLSWHWVLALGWCHSYHLVALLWHQCRQ